MKGCFKGWVAPSIVTCLSCMASIKAAWVLGVVRFNSSANIMLPKSGPATKRVLPSGE